MIKIVGTIFDIVSLVTLNLSAYNVLAANAKWKHLITKKTCRTSNNIFKKQLKSYFEQETKDQIKLIVHIKSLIGTQNYLIHNL